MSDRTRENLSQQLQGSTRGLFPSVLGVEFITASPDLIRAEMKVRDDLCTTPGVLHGGAIMAFADTLGAYGTFLNLPQGARTTTIESKTNFFAAALAGTTIVGETQPLHKGRSTMVWQTRITNPDEKRVALVTQSQMVIPHKPSAEEQLAGLFEGQSRDEQQALFARLERAGAGLYRGWAMAETDENRRDTLLEAAAREEENAQVLESRWQERERNEAG